jgi:hypothetical protein
VEGDILGVEKEDWRTVVFIIGIWSWNNFE